MVIAYYVLRELRKSIVKTPVFYITGVFLSVLLVIQFSLLIGAIQAKSAAGAAEVYARQLTEDVTGIADAQESQEVFDEIVDKFPIIGLFVGYADFSGYEISELPSVIHDSITSFFNSYIWHRVFWIVGFFVIACVIAILSDSGKYNKPRSKIDEEDDMFLMSLE